MTDDKTNARYDWFSVFGIELEYMIVDSKSLDVLPISDRILRDAPGVPPGDVHRGEVTWSNELVMHVVELKSSDPVPTLTGWDGHFHRDIMEINRRLQPFGARLLPTAMHPWMDPTRATQIWPHDHAEVYQTFHRIFNCHRHGWSNLQSVHLNLPFRDDRQFFALHAAIRLILPLLPALAASSPYCDGSYSGHLDHRLHVYGTNSRSIRSITGDVIPESVADESEYQARILEPMYQEIAAYDQPGLLREEFLNARGAIPRFGRGSIEIRVMDIAECPLVDVAICQAVIHVLRAICEERWVGMAEVAAVQQTSLLEIFSQAIEKADRAPVGDEAVRRALGWTSSNIPTAGELWHSLLSDKGLMPVDLASRSSLEHILRNGPLARRMLALAGTHPSRQQLLDLYRRLAICLNENRFFEHY